MFQMAKPINLVKVGSYVDTDGHEVSILKGATPEEDAIYQQSLRELDD